ncbi:MAG: sigma 54-interacting transcriptional regulator [Ferruginibacter sp.]
MGNKILIVEDEFIVANGLRVILEQAGYTVNGIAASAGEAEENMVKHPPDIVLLDIRLEGKLSGIDLAKKLRTAHIPFIYLSANSNQTVLQEAKETEPYGFLVKPFREKDLLVTLDIAWYRHTHSLESKLRREAHLQKQLTGICNEPLNPQQKLLKLAAAIHTYIPLDFIVYGIRPLNAEQLGDLGYLRTGFDEYQFIGEKELRTITGLSKNDLSFILRNTPSNNNARIFNRDEVDTMPGDSTLQQLVMDHFKMQSCLVFPVALGYGLSVHYFFYSRKATIYNKDHIALLNRFKKSLEELAEQSIYEGAPPAAEKTGSVSTRHAASHPVFKTIIGCHHLLLSALDLAAQVAPYNTSVLILGESGTGKEKVAQSIHTLSSRANQPFIKVNCAAIPPTLVESELFGHEKGAFTGAVEKRKGKFEQANGGTIFLDEIGELPLAMQVKLLRVLQEREIEYVGGSSPLKIDVRIVAATNRNLEYEVAQGNFRLDLYYRLNVFPITLPPLCERKSDIEALALFFADKYSRAFHKTFTGIPPSMLEEMYAYHWPGNIRELENIVEQSVVLNDGNSPLRLMRKLIPTATERKNINNLQDVKNIQQETERAYIISILKKTKGRIRGTNGAAGLLNIKPTTLESKMIKLNINKQEFI